MHLISPNETTPLAAGVLGSPTGVRAPLRFIKPQSTKPKFLSSALTGGEPEFLFASEDHLVTIADMRPFAEDLSLDREGFELLRRPSPVTDFYDDEQIEHVYYPEIEALLVRELGASRVVIFKGRVEPAHYQSGAEIPHDLQQRRVIRPPISRRRVAAGQGTSVRMVGACNEPRETKET